MKGTNWTLPATSLKHKCPASYPRLGWSKAPVLVKEGLYFFNRGKFLAINSHLCFTLAALLSPSSGVLRT